MELIRIMTNVIHRWKEWHENIITHKESSQMVNKDWIWQRFITELTRGQWNKEKMKSWRNEQ